MKLVGSRPPLSKLRSQCTALYSPQPSLLCSVQVVGPRPVHGAGALLSRVVIYLRGHDRASVPRPRSAGSRPLLAASRVRRLVHWVHPGVPILTDTLCSRMLSKEDRTEFPISHVMRCSSSSSSCTSSRSVTIALSPPVSRSFARAAGLAHLDVRLGAHLSSSPSLSRDATNSRGDLLPGG